MSTMNMNRSGTSRFLQDDKGVVSIEAAFVLPFMMTLWLGLVALLDMQNATTNVGKVTSTVADVLTQVASVSSSEIDCAFQAGNALLHPDQADELEIYVTGVSVEDGQTNVEWARGSNLSFRALPIKNTPFPELPTELKTNDSFIVVAHARLNHEPVFGSEFMDNGVVQYEYVNYFIPRISNDIKCPDCAANRTSPTQCP